jgi:hypothetical protein
MFFSVFDCKKQLTPVTLTQKNAKNPIQLDTYRILGLTSLLTSCFFRVFNVTLTSS